MKETASNEIEEFCWSVIFQLRQPMTAISGHAQRAQHLLETNPHSASRAMDEVLKQIAKMDNLLLELQARERKGVET